MKTHDPERQWPVLLTAVLSHPLLVIRASRLLVRVGVWYAHKEARELMWLLYVKARSSQPPPVWSVDGPVVNWPDFDEHAVVDALLRTTITLRGQVTIVETKNEKRIGPGWIDKVGEPVAPLPSDPRWARLLHAYPRHPILVIRAIRCNHQKKRLPPPTKCEEGKSLMAWIWPLLEVLREGKPIKWDERRAADYIRANGVPKRAEP